MYENVVFIFTDGTTPIENFLVHGTWNPSMKIVSIIHPLIHVQ